MNAHLSSDENIKILEVSSPEFEHREYIPKKYTYDGKNISPPLTLDKIPEKTKSMVLIVDNPDAPMRIRTHWLVWSIPPTREIKEQSIPGIEGITDFGLQRYRGPCPPTGLNHYHFKVYALDSLIHLNPRANTLDVEKAMSSHVLAFGELIGLYERC